MNIIDIIILAILALSLVSGMYKGFLASGLAIIGFVATWFGAMYFYPQLSAAIQSNENLMQVLQYYLDADAFFASDSVAKTLVNAVSQSDLAQTIGSLELPAVITRAFEANVLNGAFSALNLNTLGEYLGQTICGAAINVLSFLVMFVVSYIVVMLVVNLFNHVFRFPALRHFDWLLGGVFGLARGAVVALLIFSVLPLALSMVPMEVSGALLESSKLYGLFSRYDLLERLVKSVF